MFILDRIDLSVKKSISLSKHGFMSNRSTVSNLTAITQFISKYLMKVDVSYTDFSKAFNRIDHLVLLRKLSQFALGTGSTVLIELYLVDRHQSVFYNGLISKKYTASSGIPEDSNLGPLLLMIFRSLSLPTNYFLLMIVKYMLQLLLWLMEAIFKTNFGFFKTGVVFTNLLLILRNANDIILKGSAL